MSRKKSLPQKIVGTATIGLPAPVRKYVGGRVLSLLIVLAVPALLITGVVTVSWEDGRPRFSFHQDKAAVVKEEVVEKIDQLRDDPTDDGLGLRKLVPSLAHEGQSHHVLGGDWNRKEDVGEKIGERFDQFKHQLADEPTAGWLHPTAAEAQPEARQAERPLSKLKQRWQNR